MTNSNSNQSDEYSAGQISIDPGPEPEEIRLELICENITYPTPSNWQKERLKSNSNYRQDYFRLQNRTVTRLFETALTVNSSRLKPESNDRWQIPASFGIPHDANPTNREEQHNYVIWRLKMTAHCADGETRQDGWEVVVINPEKADGSA